MTPEMWVAAGVVVAALWGLVAVVRYVSQPEGEPHGQQD